MRILIDGDACPNQSDIIAMANAYGYETWIFVDYAHEVTLEGCQIVYCEIGNDSVDQQLFKKAMKNDIAITQDYGLASLLLTKEVVVLHTSGKYITEDNIETLLLTRYLSAKQRKAGKRTKGPAKRTKEDKEYFLQQLERVLKKGS